MVIAPVSPVFEDEAVYSCNPGYTLDGYNRMCCNSSGEWNGVTPTCVFGGGQIIYVDILAIHHENMSVICIPHNTPLLNSDNGFTGVYLFSSPHAPSSIVVVVVETTWPVKAKLHVEHP